MCAGYRRDRPFCTPETVRAELSGCVDFADQVLRTFGFDKIRFELSVKGGDTSKQYLGKDEEWERAEAALVEALKERDISYERMEGEAAFYGPKIDIKIEDAIGRLWQLGTIQLDFNLPERFALEYIGEDNKPHRPIMIHRALFGSIERFFGVLIEHYAGAFPMWLAPVQVASADHGSHHEYAKRSPPVAWVGLRVSRIYSRKDRAKIRTTVEEVPHACAGRS